MIFCWPFYLPGGWHAALRVREMGGGRLVDNERSWGLKRVDGTGGEEGEARKDGEDTELTTLDLTG